MNALPVPEAKVNLTVPIPNLLNLPAGAVFSEKSGRANVSVKKENDSIFIMASCDSLQALCEYYEREMTRIRGDTLVSKTTLEKEVSTGVKSPIKQFSIGFIAGVILTIIISIKLKK
jgi:hypothetical protein